MFKRRIEAKIVNPLLGNNIPAPTYATDGSAAMDLRACVVGGATIPPGGRMLVETGIALNMMDPGLVAIVASRSGLSLKHGVRVAQGIGLIDSDYQGEIMVSTWNRGQQTFTLQPLDRLAQLVVVPVLQMRFNVVEDFAASARASGGFGSTGQA
jgi:dUTP pyrophosphatase